MRDHKQCKLIKKQLDEGDQKRGEINKKQLEKHGHKRRTGQAATKSTIKQVGIHKITYGVLKTN